MKDPKIAPKNIKGALNGARQDIPQTPAICQFHFYCEKNAQVAFGANHLQLCAHVAGN